MADRTQEDVLKILAELTNNEYQINTSQGGSQINIYQGAQVVAQIRQNGPVLTRSVTTQSR